MTYPTLGYADTLTKLRHPPAGQPVTSNEAGLLDWVLGCTSQPCRKSGYDFQIINANGMPVTGYQLTAVPAAVGVTGRRGFCSDDLARITYDPNGSINCTSPLE